MPHVSVNDSRRCGPCYFREIPLDHLLSRSSLLPNITGPSTPISLLTGQPSNKLGSARVQTTELRWFVTRRKPRLTKAISECYTEFRYDGHANSRSRPSGILTNAKFPSKLEEARRCGRPARAGNTFCCAKPRSHAPGDRRHSVCRRYFQTAHCISRLERTIWRSDIFRRVRFPYYVYGAATLGHTIENHAAGLLSTACRTYRTDASRAAGRDDSFALRKCSAIRRFRKNGRYWPCAPGRVNAPRKFVAGATRMASR